MSSKKLSTSEDLNSYGANKAYIRIFKYAPLNQYDHLICVHGDRGQGTTGEVAHLKISEATYNAIAELYPIAERESNLFRSEFFEVAQVLALVHAEALAPAEEEA
ncbi:hypothetical protein SAMN06265337_0646 [Hymenobacter gelipurpurascens]|uniref:Uncharacterized protein n=1 Tax=Hymenobacter gelipurpurascens TaxID=89968 RepID=A0A212T8H4_9BACT|nr:hypothetical protein [Hymenobacter gelipurpurascens]SNC62319.1 hypothetical protein SAMN06265337_0646 [Hymenobacter gelipurpurascens]